SSPPTYWIGLPTLGSSGSRRGNRDSTDMFSGYRHRRPSRGKRGYADPSERVPAPPVAGAQGGEPVAQLLPRLGVAMARAQRRGERTRLTHVTQHRVVPPAGDVVPVPLAELGPLPVRYFEPGAPPGGDEIQLARSRAHRIPVAQHQPPAGPYEVPPV